MYAEDSLEPGSTIKCVCACMHLYVLMHVSEQRYKRPTVLLLILYLLALLFLALPPLPLISPSSVSVYPLETGPETIWPFFLRLHSTFPFFLVSFEKLFFKSISPSLRPGQNLGWLKR